MYSRILFAVDDDEALPAAVPVVVAYARKSKAVVRVLHVHRIAPAVTNGASRRLVKSVIERLEAEGVEAEGEMRASGDGASSPRRGSAAIEVALRSRRRRGSGTRRERN